MRKAEDLLSIPDAEPEQLFSGPDAVKDEFHALAKHWHPDTSEERRAHEVFAKLNVLHTAAKAKLAKGEWNYPGRLVMKSTKDHTYQLRYFAKRPFELGELYMGKTHACYTIKPEFRDLAEAGKMIVSNFRYANPKMREETERYLPKIEMTFDTVDRHVWIVKKTEELILARDLLSHYGGALDPKHVAWIVSSLLNLACYLQYANLTHNAITLDNYLVSPQFHSGTLIGGWWYAAKKGERMLALPEESLAIVPRDALVLKRADHRLDLNLIRNFGLDLLGSHKEVPEPMAKWLRYASVGDALGDYEAWRAVLKNSFGARRFVELKVSPSDIYK